MIEQAFEKIKSMIVKPTNVENEWTPVVKVMSTVDEGKGMTDIERKQHVWHETKKI